jgi:hypothetical protein
MARAFHRLPPCVSFAIELLRKSEPANAQAMEIVPEIASALSTGGAGIASLEAIP